MKAFIDDYRDACGVEPICKVLPIAPSTYYLHAARKADPELRSNPAKQDEALSQQICRVGDEHFQNYGTRNVWLQLGREGLIVARCTVGRLMRSLGPRRQARQNSIKTTRSDANAVCPLDRVNRQFSAERLNALWVAEFPMSKPGRALFTRPS